MLGDIHFWSYQIYASEMRNRTTWHIDNGRLRSRAGREIGTSSRDFVASSNSSRSTSAHIENTAPVVNAHYAPLQSSLGLFRMQTDSDNVSETFSLAKSLTKGSSDMREQLWCIQRPFFNKFNLCVGDYIAVERWSGTDHGWVIAQKGTKGGVEYQSFKVRGEIFETSLPKSPSVVLGGSSP